jgi:hypothetical protein
MPPAAVPPVQLPLLPIYGSRFLPQHAGRIVEDPATAVTELVANAWDAGAEHVDITWPLEVGQPIRIHDDGSGMTREQLERRWRTLYYDRSAEQGVEADFPPGVRKRVRHAFGRNGVGRHAMFCFADRYTIETSRDGYLTVASVTQTSGDTPFALKVESEAPSKSHGTCLHTIASRVALDADVVRELIGARFVADPDFCLTVNGTLVTLTDLEHLCDVHTVKVESLGEVRVLRFDSERTARTSKQGGVAWWSRGRLVGASSWVGLDGPYIDARTAAAKRYTYVVQADLLIARVKQDWSGFHMNPDVLAVFRAVDEFIRDDLRAATADARRERKRLALEDNKNSIRRLPVLSQDHVAAFVDELQGRCQSLGQTELGFAVEVFAKLEKARSGYSLLEKLNSLKADDLDGLNSILAEWSVSDARKVLGELRYRLDLIKQLQDILRRGNADELHELQPIFERGLWFFGPEFESISFESNRWLSSVVRELLGKEGVSLLTIPNNRPDFVVIPDASIGVYSCDDFDDHHEVNGLATVVIIELKRGGSTIGSANKDQAMRYCRELRKVVGRSVPITAYVLGEGVDSDAETIMEEGRTRVVPRSYPIVLRQAHARTFNLFSKVELVEKTIPRDEDLVEVLGSSTPTLFEDSTLMPAIVNNRNEG